MYARLRGLRLLSGLLFLQASALPADEVTSLAPVAAAEAGPDSYWPALVGAQYTYVLQHQTARDSRYRLQVFNAIGLLPLRMQVGPDVQLIRNPGFNQDRGPVRFYALPVHLEY